MKIADLKTFVETKLLSKSDKALEKIGSDEQKSLGQHSVGSRGIFNVCIHLSLFFRRLILSVACFFDPKVRGNI